MSQHDDGVSLQHMLDHAREAVKMVAGKKREDLGVQRCLNCLLSG